jgi:hypothetical protein
MWKLLIAICLFSAVPALGQEKVSAGEPKQVDKPTCTSFDLQFETPKNGVLTFAGQPTNQDAARFVMQRMGEAYWDDVTRRGKKSPGICMDDNHPYYIMTWTDTTISTVHTLPPSRTRTTVTSPTGETTTEDSVAYQEIDAPRSVHSVTVEIYVVDYTRGCLVLPAVFGAVSKINHDPEKAAKDAMTNALGFLLRTGTQTPPKSTLPIDCVQPDFIGVHPYYIQTPGTSPKSSAQ